ncbi:hypothetical protein R1flu_015304 [Riccia fluitans]|uniref:Uncharacterized protein n=1 Tax=Riccia fluitans TaxID=41844 RepID=A0ABD1YIJ2_9MARC
MKTLPWLELFPLKSMGEENRLTDVDQPLIKATYIRGKEAVEQFRNHLACFSRHNGTGPGHISYEQAEAIERVLDGNISAWLVREELKWVWQTNSSCPFWAVNRDDLCRRIGSRRNVMVVGDSINRENSWTLMNHLVLNGTGYTNNRSTDGVYEMCGDIFGAGNGFKVFFVRNDRLSPVLVPSENWETNFYEFPWLNLVDEYDVKLLIMNGEAHYEDDVTYVQALRNIFTILSGRFPHVRVIYRNTQPGNFQPQLPSLLYMLYS